jgi:hypothetical protein
MPNSKSHVALRFQNRVYRIAPDFRLVREIEDELGGIAALHAGFLRPAWKVSDLVALVHMMLQAAGETVDYIFLGNLMLKEGLNGYLSCAVSFLQMVLSIE